MSFDALLDRTATVTHRAQTGIEDRYNVPEWSETTSTGVPYRRSDAKESEDLNERVLALQTFELFFPPEVVLDASDMVTDETDGLVMEIVGPPYLVHAAATAHHWQAQARAIDQQGVA